MKHCIACHDAKEAEGDLVMENFAALMKGGENGSPVVAGKPDQSLLFQQIAHARKPFMPPPKKGDRLSDEEVAVIRDWIAGGATAPAPGEVLAALPPKLVVPTIAPKAAPRRSVEAMAYDAKTKSLAVARYGVVELMNAETRAVVRTLGGHRGSVNAVCFSADGSRVAAGAGQAGVKGEIRLWNAADGALVRTLSGHTDAVYSVAMSPDGKILASGSYDQEIILWDMESGAPLRTLKGHNGAVFSLSFRGDGKMLASASADRTVKLWEVSTGMRLDTLSEPTKDLHAVAFSPDGKHLAAGGVDNRIRVWEISPSGKEGTNRILQSRFAHEGAILRLLYTADGKTLLSSGDEGLVKLWDAGDDVTNRLSLAKQPDWPTAIASVLDDKIVAVGRLDGSLKFYDSRAGQVVPPPKPQLLSIEPRGVQRGTPSTLKLTGKFLAGITAIKTSDPRLAGKIVDASGADIVSIELTAAADLPPTGYDLTVETAGGATEPVKIFADTVPQSVEHEPNDTPEAATPVSSLPASYWGTLGTPGDVDCYAFPAKSGQTVVLDVASKRLGSKADLVLSVLDTSGRLLMSRHDFDGDPDALLAFTAPADGRYIARLTDLRAQGDPSLFYRLTIGVTPYVTGCYPLGVPANSQTSVRLLGFNLPPDAAAKVTAGAAGEAAVPLDPAVYRSRRAMTVLIDPTPSRAEAEPNDTPDHAMAIALPAVVDGQLWPRRPDQKQDVDLFRFDAKAGQSWMIETIAAQRGSPADTRIEVLRADGRPVPRMILRAVRDTSVTFRGIDADAGGVRLVHWEEMDLNQYLYLQGEVVRLFLAPRGPDSEWGFYLLNGKRKNYFDTSPTAHALDEQCYIVEPHPAAETGLAPNGLPTFALNYANDDDATRKAGADSRLRFTAPSDGAYLIRVTDTRGFGGDRYGYRLVVRPPQQDFSVTVDTADPAVPAGAGRAFSVRADRLDDFDGPIQIDTTGLPPGFTIAGPLVIQAGHIEAKGTIFAALDAPTPAAEVTSKLIASATIDGKPTTRPAGTFGKITLAPKPQLFITLDSITKSPAPAAARELTIAPGQLVPAMLKIVRNGATGIINFDVENLPHGVIVADIGLNGVQILDGQAERQIFLQCARNVPDVDRPCYARSREAGNPTSPALMIHVRNVPVQASR